MNLQLQTVKDMNMHASPYMSAAALYYCTFQGTVL